MFNRAGSIKKLCVPHGDRGARAYNGSLQAEPPAGLGAELPVRGQSFAP